MIKINPITEYTAGTACVTALPEGEGTGDIGNSLRQSVLTGRPRVTVLMRRPLLRKPHNAAAAPNTMAADPEESDVLRRLAKHASLAEKGNNAMT